MSFWTIRDHWGWLVVFHGQSVRGHPFDCKGSPPEFGTLSWGPCVRGTRHPGQPGAALPGRVPAAGTHAWHTYS